MTIVISISLIIAFIIYLKLYNSHPYFLLDKDGVIKKEHRRTFCHSFIHLDPNDLPPDSSKTLSDKVGAVHFGACMGMDVQR